MGLDAKTSYLNFLQIYLDMIRFQKLEVLVWLRCAMDIYCFWSDNTITRKTTAMVRANLAIPTPRVI